MPAASGVHERGFTLAELMVVIAVIGILLGIAAVSYKSMQERYTVEQEIKGIYADVMNARMQAMQQSSALFTVFTTTQYTVYKDSSPAPDGNGALDPASDTVVLRKSLSPKYPLLATWPTASPLRFSSKGLVATGSSGTVRLSTTAESEYDCIFVEEIKTTLGKWNGTKCIGK